MFRDILSSKGKTVWGKTPAQLMPEENDIGDLLWTITVSNKIMIEKELRADGLELLFPNGTNSCHGKKISEILEGLIEDV